MRQIGQFKLNYAFEVNFEEPNQKFEFFKRD